MLSEEVLARIAERDVARRERLAETAAVRSVWHARCVVVLHFAQSWLYYLAKAAQNLFSAGVADKLTLGTISKSSLSD